MTMQLSSSRRAEELNIVEDLTRDAVDVRAGAFRNMSSYPNLAEGIASEAMKCEFESHRRHHLGSSMNYV